MRFHLECNQLKTTEVLISGSKSISNRLLILKSLYENISILNISSSDDTKFLENALQSIDRNEINIGHAGTAMRFLTALLSYKTTKNIKLFGSNRMHKRPIGILVNSLNELGASIEFIKNSNFPPLLIKPAKMVGKKIRVRSGISSQFISSLLLIGPKLKGGIEIELDDIKTSFPYIEMTINLLKKIGVDVNQKDRIIRVNEQNKVVPIEILVESDWSSASYFYSIVSMADIGFSLTLKNFIKKSIQGDSLVSRIYESFGVSTLFSENKIIIKKVNKSNSFIKLNLSANPDLAQTICVSCLAQKIDCELTGLHTLKIKETDRIIALVNEIKKFGLKPNYSNDSISFRAVPNKLKSGVEINTYQDHRMAMAFACLAVKTDIIIKNPTVVTKSYRDFWSDLKKIGIHFKKS